MICFQERLTKKMIKLSLIRSLREIAEIWEVEALGFDKFIGKIKFHNYWKLKSCHPGHKTFTRLKLPLKSIDNLKLKLFSVLNLFWSDLAGGEMLAVWAVKHYWGLQPPSVGPEPPAWAQTRIIRCQAQVSPWPGAGTGHFPEWGEVRTDKAITMNIHHQSVNQLALSSYFFSELFLCHLPPVTPCHGTRVVTFLFGQPHSEYLSLIVIIVIFMLQWWAIVFRERKASFFSI